MQLGRVISFHEDPHRKSRGPFGSKNRAPSNPAGVNFAAIRSSVERLKNTVLSSSDGKKRVVSEINKDIVATIFIGAANCRRGDP